MSYSTRFRLPLIATLLFFSMSSWAEMKIGFVNGPRLLSDSPYAIKAKKKIEKEFEKRDQELQKMARQLQGMQDNLDKNAPTMSESDRRNKEREFNDLNRDFQRKQREFREDLSLRQNEEMAGITDKVNKAIKQIADAEKFDLIIQEAIYVNGRLDLTDRIMKSLGDGSK